MGIKSKKSEVINEIIALAAKYGNHPVDYQTGWSKMDEVIIMSHPLRRSLKKKVDVNFALRYSEHTDPHYLKAKIYSDDENRVSLSFPMEETEEQGNVSVSDSLISELRSKLWK